MIPAEATVNRLMDRTGMDRVQAIRHLRDRGEIQRRVTEQREREGRRHDK